MTEAETGTRAEDDLLIITKRCGSINPESIDEYIAAGGYEALKKALRMNSEEIIAEVKASGLKGRGGAGFLAGIKMDAVYRASETPKYIICNADESEPGNFKDRYLMEKDPHQVLEGMTICAFAVGASDGYVYIRGEYDTPKAIMSKAIRDAEAKAFLGSRIQGTDFSFKIKIVSGAGAYVCGEESALIESVEGKPGRPRFKPPFPTASGLFDRPTQLNNVETLSNIPFIINEGGAAFASIGTLGSSGTKLVSLSGNVRKPGVYEVPFGTPLHDIVFKLGGGVADGRNGGNGRSEENIRNGVDKRNGSNRRRIGFVQLGGASGPIIPESMLDMKLDYGEMAGKGLSIGSGAIIVVDDRTDLFDALELIADFFRHESCGKCTPCREGNTHLLKLIRKFKNGEATIQDLELLQSLVDVMSTASLCGLGQAAVTAFQSTLKYFKGDYLSRICGNNRGSIPENAREDTPENAYENVPAYAPAYLQNKEDGDGRDRYHHK